MAIISFVTALARKFNNILDYSSELKKLIRAYVYIRDSEVLHERKPSTVISKMQFRSKVIKLPRECGLKIKRLCWITSFEEESGSDNWHYRGDLEHFQRNDCVMT